MFEYVVLVIEFIGMFNGLILVFIEVFFISGLMFVRMNCEREMIIWLVQRDQFVVGIGMVGFDIDEMFWFIDIFEEEKDFMFCMIIYVIVGVGWERLSYKL